MQIGQVEGKMTKWPVQKQTLRTAQNTQNNHLRKKESHMEAKQPRFY